MQKWLSVTDAARRILDGVAPLTERENIPLRQMSGRVLAADIVAPFNVPTFDNSAMDGFACRYDDIGGGGDAEVILNIVGESFAGHPCARSIGGGECVKIMTGAQLPKGADIVVPVEETRNVGNAQTAITSGRRRRFLHCRFAGEDLRENAVAVCAGQLCRPAHIGLMASLGVGRAEVFRRLRVAFFSTGDELREAGKNNNKPGEQKLGRGEIYDSNRHTLLAMIERMGFDALDIGVVPDNVGKIESAVDEAARAADFIISSGGASVGEADFIRQVLASRGEVLFWKVAMRPGRPLAYGKVGNVDFLGLPGNPVSVMVCFYQFAAAALWKKAGRKNTPPPPLFAATAATDVRKVKGRTEFQRATMRPGENGEWLVMPAADQGSGILSSMANADCFIVLPEESEGAAKGDIVRVQLFEGLT